MPHAPTKIFKIRFIFFSLGQFPYKKHRAQALYKLKTKGKTSIKLTRMILQQENNVTINLTMITNSILFSIF